MIDGRQTLSILLQGGLRHIVELGPPPDLDAFPHPITMPPAGARLLAWLKLKECERRLVVATWAMDGTDPVSGKNRVLAEDSVAALFQSVEAVFQVLKEEVDWRTAGCTFDAWLEGLIPYSLPLRALRTIRHFTVHVGDLRASSSLAVALLPKPSDPFVSRCWLLPEVSKTHLSSLRSPKLKSTDLPAWDRTRRSEPARVILESAIRDLRGVVERAEALRP